MQKFHFFSLKQTTIVLSLLAAFYLSTPLSWAAETDRKEPIRVEADYMQYDSENQINRYSGNVIANQGTLTIRSAAIEVRQDQDGYQLGVATGSKERRAFFRQDRNETNEHIEGEALRLEYDGRTATIRLAGDAVLRRYRNNVLYDQTSGGVINYNDNTSLFTVESGSNRNSPSGRVIGVFTPPSN